MKMTMHIDEPLLKRVMKHFDVSTKTEAVHAALVECDRSAAQLKVFKEGLGLSASELKAAIDPDYDLAAMRAAETPGKYGKARSRR